MKDNFAYPVDVGVRSPSRGTAAKITTPAERAPEPSMLDGILGNGPIGAIMDAFSHYTDGIFDEPKLPTGLMPTGDLLGPGGLVGPHVPTGDFDAENMPKGLLDPLDNVVPFRSPVRPPSFDMF